LRKFNCDAICIGEGEHTLVELLGFIEQGKNLRGVKGIAFLDEDGKFVLNDARPLIADINAISIPAYDMFPIDHYSLIRFPNMSRNERAMPILSGRGCTFKCNFCYRMDKGFRPRRAEGIIEEVRLLVDNYNINYIIFSDELLMSSTKRTHELCEIFIRAGLNFKWSCNGRLNFAKKELLELMKRAGCVFINYGIESVNDTVLKKMNKSLTVSQITDGIEATLKAGISPGFNIIFGNIDEDAECLKNGVNFLLKYDDFKQQRNIRPVTPYPGSPLFDYAVNKGLIRDIEDFYENKHTNSDLLTVNFTNMTDEEYYTELYQANKILLDNYSNNLHKTNDLTLCKLYKENNIEFRGFRHT